MNIAELLSSLYSNIQKIERIDERTFDITAEGLGWPTSTTRWEHVQLANGVSTWCRVVELVTV